MQNDNQLPKFLASTLKKVVGDRRKHQFCPVCDAKLASKDINIEQGVALCPECGELSKLHELNYSQFLMEEVLIDSRKDVEVNNLDNQVKIKINQGVEI